MTSLGVVERTERVEGKQRGREMGPVSGFLRKPRAFQTLSRCTVFPQLLLVNFKYSHAGVVCPALMGGREKWHYVCLVRVWCSHLARAYLMESKGRWASLASWLVCGVEKCVSGEPEVWQGICASLWTEVCTQWQSDSSIDGTPLFQSFRLHRKVAPV